MEPPDGIQDKNNQGQPSYRASSFLADTNLDRAFGVPYSSKSNVACRDIVPGPDDESTYLLRCCGGIAVGLWSRCKGDTCPEIGKNQKKKNAFGFLPNRNPAYQSCQQGVKRGEGRSRVSEPVARLFEGPNREPKLIWIQTHPNVDCRNFPGRCLPDTAPTPPITSDWAPRLKSV